MDIKSFIDIMNNKAIILDADFKIKLFNREWKDYLKNKFDKSFEEMIGQNYLSEFNNLGLLSQNNIREIKSRLESLTNGDLNKFSVECLHNISKKTQKEWFEITVKAFADNYIIIYDEITEKKCLEQNLKIMKEQINKIFEKVPVGIILMTKEGKILKANNTACKISGYRKEKLENSSIYGTLINKNDYNKVKSGTEKIFNGEDLSIKLEVYDSKNKFYYMHLFETTIILPEYGKVIFSMQLDLRSLRKKEDKLNYVISHDELTGLYNKNYFKKKINKLRETKQFPISIIFSDINGLKLVNDTYGFSIGDKLIVKTGKLLNSVTRHEDTLTRMGGDEFALILPNTSGETAKKIVSRIRKATDKIKVKDTTLSLGIGCATIRNVSHNYEYVLNKAEQDMNKDKLNKGKSFKYKLVNNLIKTLDVKSNETREHVMRVEKLAEKFGEYLNLDYQKIIKLSLLAKLHDIGKVSISEEILKKPGKLNENEWSIMQEHCKRGYEIANSIDEFSPIAKYILYHHERWDGRGYPEGLMEEEIPLLSRIITIVDSFDVMTHTRPYTEAISVEQAFKELKECSGTQFDSDLVDKFCEMFNNDK